MTPSNADTSVAEADEFHIWERLLQNVRKEIQSDEDGIARNLACIEDLNGRNEWLGKRLEQNRKAARLIAEQSK